MNFKGNTIYLDLARVPERSRGTNTNPRGGFSSLPPRVAFGPVMAPEEGGGGEARSSGVVSSFS